MNIVVSDVFISSTNFLYESAFIYWLKNVNLAFYMVSILP